jgi:hypothetical protein
LRKNLSKIHIWGGLLCAPILVLFGFTTLHFNHQFSFMNAGEKTMRWEKEIEVQNSDDNDELCRGIYQALALRGNIYYWTANRDDNGEFSFRAKHPGKNYIVRVDQARRLATVEETRFGPLTVASELHGARTYTGAGLGILWVIYTYLSIAFVVFAGVSGVYFWSKHRDKTRLDWVLLLGVAGGSLLLLATVRLWG